MNEHDLVILTRPIPERKLETGDVGTIVHVYENGKAFEVEFTVGSDKFFEVVTLEPKDIRAFSGQEILHARTVAV